MILIILISLIFVGIFSAAETSFVAADKVALAVTGRTKIETSSVLFFLKQNDLFFATVVVATSLAITTFSSVSQIMLHENLGFGASVILPLTTVVGFLIGELIPKSLALESPETIARGILPFVRLFYLIAHPLISMTARFSNFFVGILFDSKERSGIFQRKDVYRFLGTTVTGGYLDKIESDIIRRLLTNAALPVKNFVVPRTQLVGLDIHSKVDKLRDLFEKTGKTKVLVYDSSVDNVIGVVHAKDVFNDARRIDELISDVLFVPESISLFEVLEEFKSERVYSAIVIDEFGGTLGLVTASDIMETFLGEVATWSTVENLKQLGPKQFLMQGDTALPDVEKLLRVNLPKGEYTTISGLLVSHSGRIPLKGERMNIGEIEFLILDSDGRKLNSVKVILK